MNDSSPSVQEEVTAMKNQNSVNEEQNLAGERHLSPSPALATPRPWVGEGRTVYALQGTGRYSGKGNDYKEDLCNRFSFNVQGAHTPESELEANAELIVHCVNSFEAQAERIAQLEEANAALVEVAKEVAFLFGNKETHAPNTVAGRLAERASAALSHVKESK